MTTTNPKELFVFIPPEFRGIGADGVYELIFEEIDEFSVFLIDFFRGAKTPRWFSYKSKTLDYIKCLYDQGYDACDILIVTRNGDLLAYEPLHGALMSLDITFEIQNTNN